MDSSAGESGIQDSDGFAALVSAYQPVQLFAQFFDDPLPVRTTMRLLVRRDR
jgi:hypothetical protein